MRMALHRDIPVRYLTSEKCFYRSDYFLSVADQSAMRFHANLVVWLKMAIWRIIVDYLSIHACLVPCISSFG